jgi:hypothetical protein
MAKKKFLVLLPQPTWAALNDDLRECKEAFACDLLTRAKESGWPSNMLVRIQKRYNRLRRSRELRELTSTK